MRNEKLVIRNTFLLFAVCCLLFAAGCSDIFEPPAGSFDTGDLAPGMGYLTLSIAGGNAGQRTIMPVTPGLSNLTYQMVFYIIDTDDEAISMIRDYDELSDAIELEAGNYSLKIIAYSDDECQKPVAEGNVPDIEIVAGGGTSCIIHMKAIITDASAKGTFTWNFIPDESIDASAITVKLSVTPIDIAGNSSGTPVVLFNDTLGEDNLTGQEDLFAGYYDVLITLKRSNTEDVVIYEILYVYENLESILDLEISEEFLDRNRYTVTFELNNGSADEIRSVDHGNASSLTLPSAPSKTSYIFDAWYTNDNQKWSGLTSSAQDRIAIRDFTLHAKWLGDLSAATINVTSSHTFSGSAQTPTFTVTHDGVTLTAGTDYTSSYSSNTNAGTAGITVTAKSGSGYDGSKSASFTINPQPITAPSVTVTAPMYGHSPNSVATPGNASFTSSPATWDPDDDPFEGGEKYTVTVTLTVASGNYTFTGLTGPKINGYNATATGNSGSTVTLSYEFGATDTRILTGIRINGQPSVLTYTHGDTLDSLSGLEVILTYDGGTAEQTEDTVAYADFEDYLLTTSPAINAGLTHVGNNGKPIRVITGNSSIYADTSNLTVNKKALTIASAAHTREYDSTTAATGVTVTLSGKIGTDDVSPGTVTANYTNAAAGTKTLNITGVTLTGDDAGNYTVTLDSNFAMSTGGITQKVITTVAITGVTAPATGVAPSMAASGTGNFTVGAAEWSPVETPFRGNTVYTVTVPLTVASANYTFTGGLTTMTINGSTATVAANGGSTASLSYQFSATAAKTVSGIEVKTQPTLSYTDGSALDLTGMVVTLTYNDTTTLDVAFANFGTHSITANPTNGTTLTISSHHGKPVTVTCNGQTDTTNNLTVSSIPITAATITVTAPATGVAPNTSASGTGNFSVGAVTWKQGGSTFAGSLFLGGIAYTAEVTLTANTNYTFAAGLTGTINGSTAAISGTPGATATLTYTFPATGAPSGINITFNLSHPAGTELQLTGATDLTIDINNASHQYTLTAPTEFTSYEWFVNNVSVTGEETNEFVLNHLRFNNIDAGGINTVMLVVYQGSVPYNLTIPVMVVAN